MSDPATADTTIKSTLHHRAFEDHPEPTLIVDPETFSILQTNARASELSGYNLKDLTQRTLTDIIQPWDSAKFVLALRTEDFASPELRGVTTFTQGGKALEVDLLIRSSSIAKRHVWIVVLADAAPRLRLEEQLRQSQKMESIGMLAGGIAHDFNNLLTIISGYSHMLADGLAGDPRNRSAAEQVIKASERAAALTSQLLAFSRRQAAQVKTIDINGLVKGMEPMLRRLIGEHINMRISAAPDLGNVHADPGQIEQIVMNLVVNARDAMPEGGRLLLETDNVDLNDTYVGEHLEVRPGPYVRLAVSDTGVGMDLETREKVFEPFFTTKEKGQGTGLGLSMVYGIAKRSGGTVNLYSEPGRGTTVKVYLPRATRPELDIQPDALADPVGGWETVLLVEDEDEVRSFVRTALESKGYRVFVAADGDEALRISKQHADPIHLLITDMVMPEMSGADVAKRLRRQRPGLQVLYMSGYTDAAINHNGFADRPIHFISKPFNPSDLARKVRSVLDEKRENTRQKHRAGS